MNEQERRSTLIEILMGEQILRPGEVNVSINVNDELAKGSIGIKEITFSSNLILRMRTNDDGTLRVEYVQENIPGYLLEPKKKNGKAIVAHHQHAANYYFGGDEQAYQFLEEYVR